MSISDEQLANLILQFRDSADARKPWVVAVHRVRELLEKPLFVEIEQLRAKLTRQTGEIERALAQIMATGDAFEKGRNRDTLVYVEKLLTEAIDGNSGVPVKKKDNEPNPSEVEQLREKLARQIAKIARALAQIRYRNLDTLMYVEKILTGEIEGDVPVDKKDDEPKPADAPDVLRAVELLHDNITRTEAKIQEFWAWLDAEPMKPAEPTVEKSIAEAVVEERARIVEWLREPNNKPEGAGRSFLREWFASAIERCEHKRIEGGPTHAPNDPPPKRETVNKPRDLPVSVRCPDCGPQDKCDEDVCCLACGRGLWLTYADGHEEDDDGVVVKEAKP